MKNTVEIPKKPENVSEEVYRDTIEASVNQLLTSVPTGVLNDQHNRQQIAERIVLRVKNLARYLRLLQFLKIS